MSRFQYLIIGPVILCLCFMLSGNPFAEELPRPLSGTDSQKDTEGQRFITIDFDNVDIHLFIKYISELSGKNFVVDKAVGGNVTIISPTKISEEEAYKVFESVLEVHGFTTVEAGAVIKILPSARARSQNVEMLQMGASGSPEDRVVTQLVPLKYSSPDDLKKVLAPLVSQTSVIISHAPSGMLIITETQSNIQKLLGIIEVLDVQSRADEVAFIPLENASAGTVAKILSSIYLKSPRLKKGSQARTSGVGLKVVPYERMNALIVLANASEMGRVKGLIAMLDTAVQRAEGNIHVYYLQNATAVELAKVLNALPEEKKQEVAGRPKAVAISKNVRVMADEETNSLIITGTKSEYAVLMDVIAKLDIPRRMVYLEALIMEVDADKTFDVGVEWAAGGTFDDGTGTLVTGFSGDEGFGLLDGIKEEAPGLPAGFSFGVLKQGIKIGNVTFPNIAAILRAVKTDSAVNVIATPQILTMDNNTADISVGENVPFITSRNTSDALQDYTQYEYKDVATKLSITPHINQADALRLEIETEVVRLKNQSDTPTTFKRTAKTTVILNDKDSIVIGGMIGYDGTENEWKIPILGDIPLLGWLFKTHTSTSRKVNMFIFITPRIIRNPADLTAVTLKKEDQMGKVLPSIQRELHKEESSEHVLKLITLGYDSLWSGDLEEAKDYFQIALEIDPANPFALMNMGVVYEKEGNAEQALEMYRAVADSDSDAIADEPDDPEKDGVLLRDLARESVDRISHGNVAD